MIPATSLKDGLNIYFFLISVKQWRHPCQWKPPKSLKPCPKAGTVLSVWKNPLAWRPAADATSELTVRWPARKRTGRLQARVRVTRTGARSAAVKRMSTGRFKMFLAKDLVWLRSRTSQHWPELLSIDIAPGKKPKTTQGSQVSKHTIHFFVKSHCVHFKCFVYGSKKH